MVGFRELCGRVCILSEKEDCWSAAEDTSSRSNTVQDCNDSHGQRRNKWHLKISMCSNQRMERTDEV